MELFIIPTHRECKRAVESIIKEMNYARKRNINVELVVLDNSREETYLKNDEFLKAVKKSYQDLKIHHISLNDMDKIVHKLSKAMDLKYEELAEMLLPNSIDYGKISNFIYIISILLGADRFHRRDSDCFIDELEEKDFPVVHELEFLGKDVNEISGVHRQEELDYGSCDKICIVGGDYYGNWDLDMKQVNESNPKAMEHMMKICGIPEEDIQKQFDIKYNVAEEEEEKDKNPILSSVFEVSQSPECGNISMFDVYNYIPNFIGENGIGFDNHTYFMAFLVKTPIIYHFNRILHMHDTNRTTDINLFNYWKGIAKMVDFDCYHLNFIESGYGDVMCSDSLGIKAIINSCNELLPDLLVKALESIDYNTRVQRIETIANKILRPTNINIYNNIADYLYESRFNIIEKLDKEYELSIKLQRIWSKIVHTLKELDITDIISD